MQPSTGNPAFERLPLEEHAAHLICDRFVATGRVEGPPVGPGADDMSRRIAEAAERGDDPFADLPQDLVDALDEGPDDDGEE